MGSEMCIRDSPHLDDIAMAGKADVTLSALNPLMLGLLFAQLVQIGIRYADSVQLHRETRSPDRYPLLVPLPNRGEVPAKGRRQGIDRAMELPFLEILVLVGGIIQNLQLHKNYQHFPML